MNFVFWFVLSVDFMIMLLHYLYSFEMIKKHKIFNQMKVRNEKLSKDMDEKIPNSILGKVLFYVLTLLTIILMFAFLTSIFWLPITLWLTVDWQSGIITFMLISALFSLLMIYVYAKIVPGYVLKEGAIVKEAIYVTFFVLLSIFIRYGSPFPLDQIVERVYTKSTSFNSTMSVLIPVLIIGLLITNAYLFINGLAYITDKTKKIVKARTKIIDILTIFAFTSFFSLLFVIDRELSFLTTDNATRYYETLDIFKNILVAVIVPLILSRFINSNTTSSLNSSSNESVVQVIGVKVEENDNEVMLDDETNTKL